MDERPKLPHYDPDYCLKVAKWAASICVGILVIELLVLLFVAPNNGKCPGWTIYAENGSAISLWLLTGTLSGVPTIWICYVVVRWEQKFSQKMYDSIAYRRPIFPNFGFGRNSKLSSKELKPDMRDLNFEQIFLINANALFLRVSIGWCLVCAFPLLLTITKCTNVPRYFGD